jgi:hypothetical protein
MILLDGLADAFKYQSSKSAPLLGLLEFIDDQMFDLRELEEDHPARPGIISVLRKLLQATHFFRENATDLGVESLAAQWLDMPGTKGLWNDMEKNSEQFDVHARQCQQPLQNGAFAHRRRPGGLTRSAPSAMQASARRLERHRPEMGE